MLAALAMRGAAVDSRGKRGQTLTVTAGAASEPMGKRGGHTEFKVTEVRPPVSTPTTTPTTIRVEAAAREACGSRVSTQR